MCDCKEKTVLVKPEHAMQAYEHWCPKHGYQNDCWMCNPSQISTEVCVMHANAPIRTFTFPCFGGLDNRYPVVIPNFE